MKIINTAAYRDISPDEPTIKTTPVTDLLSTESLNDGSLIHIVCYNENDKSWDSRKMDVKDFKNKVYESVQNTLKTKYWDTHEKDEYEHILPEDGKDDSTRPPNTSFCDLVDYLKKNTCAPEEVEKEDPNGFIDHIYYDFDVIKRYMVLRDLDLEKEIEDATKGINENVGCLFQTNMTIWRYKRDNNNEMVVKNNSSLTHNLNENDNCCDMKINIGNKISSTYTVPKSGNLVAYGWLDSSKCLNNKAIPTSFCVIEGYINNNWEILAVQNVIPAKNITYVGFNLPVKKGLMIRARTGFPCGGKSGEFPFEQDGYDSLSNSVQNGFKCAIYNLQTT